jgi:hypothetical protein
MADMSDKKVNEVLQHDELTEEQLDEAIKLIARGAEMLGFAVAIPQPKGEDDIVKGLILGTDEYVDQMCECHNKLFGDEDETDSE